MFSLTSAQLNSKWTWYWGSSPHRTKSFRLEPVTWSHQFIYIFGGNTHGYGPDMCCILTFDQAKHAIPKTAEVTHPDGSYGKKSRRWVWLTIWDKVKSHATVIDWCTGRERPLNCMTVISAWWQSNMLFQRYWVKTGSQWVLESRWWQDVVEKASIQQSRPPGLRLSSSGERERDADGHQRGGSICCSSVRSPAPSHTQTLQIKWEVYFF